MGKPEKIEKKRVKGVSKIIGLGTLSIDTLFERTRSDKRSKGIATNPEQLRLFIRNRPKLFDLTPDDKVRCMGTLEFVAVTIGSGTWSINTLFEKLQSDLRIKSIPYPEQLRRFIRNRPKLFDLTPDDEVSCLPGNPYGPEAFVTNIIGSGTWSINALFERTQSDERTKNLGENPEQLRGFIRNRPKLFDLTPDGKVSCLPGNPYRPVKVEEAEAFVTNIIESGAWSVTKLFEIFDLRGIGVETSDGLRAFIRNRPKLFYLAPDDKVSRPKFWNAGSVTKTIGSGTWSINSLFEKLKTKSNLSQPETLRGYIRNRPEYFNLTHDDEVSCCASNRFLGPVEFVTITIGTRIWSINTLFEKLQSDSRIKDVASNPEQLQAYFRDRPKHFDLTPYGEVSKRGILMEEAEAFVTNNIGPWTCWSVTKLFESIDMRGINFETSDGLRAFIRNRPKLFDLNPDDEVSCCASNPHLATVIITITIGSVTWSINSLFEKLQSDSSIKGIASNPEQFQAYLRDRSELFDLTPDGKVSCCVNNPFLQDQPVMMSFNKYIHQAKENVINCMDHDAENSVIHVHNGSFKLLFKNGTYDMDPKYLQKNPDFYVIPNVGFHLKAFIEDFDLDQLFVYVVQRLTHDAIKWGDLIEDCVSMMKAKRSAILPGMKKKNKSRKQSVKLVIEMLPNVFVCKLNRVELKSKPDDQISPERIVMEILRAQELTNPKSMQDLFDALPKFITVNSLQSPTELETFCSKMVTLQHLVKNTKSIYV